MVVVVMLVGCATTRTVQTKTTACDGVMSRFEDRAKLPREERLTLRNEALKCLDANEPEAAAALRTNTHREFLQADLEDALATADEAKAKTLLPEWANGGANIQAFSQLKHVERLREYPWARAWIARIATSSLSAPRSDLAGWSKWLGGYFGKSDVDLRVATALGEQARGRLALWQGRVLKARIDPDATWMVVEEFVPTVVLRGQTVDYYNIQNHFMEQREPRGLYFLVRIPGNDERYARYDTVVVLGEITGAREKKSAIVDQVDWQPVADEAASLPVVDAWDLTPKGVATWSETVR